MWVPEAGLVLALRITAEAAGAERVWVPEAVPTIVPLRNNCGTLHGTLKRVPGNAFNETLKRVPETRSRKRLNAFQETFELFSRNPHC